MTFSPGESWRLMHLRRGPTRMESKLVETTIIHVDHVSDVRSNFCNTNAQGLYGHGLSFVVSEPDAV